MKKANQIEKMSRAEIIAGILRGTLPDYANVRGALEEHKWLSDIEDIDDIEAYAESVDDAEEEFTISKSDSGYWWYAGQKDGYWCSFPFMLEHYLACYKIQDEAPLEWVDELYAENAAREAEEANESHWH
jgi:hypothetical protein